MKRVFWIACMAMMAVFTACEGPEGPPGLDGPPGKDAAATNFFIVDFKVEGSDWHLAPANVVEGQNGSYWETNVFWAEAIDDYAYDNAIFVMYLQMLNDAGDVVKVPLPYIYYGINPETRQPESYTYTYDLAPPTDNGDPGSVVFRMIVEGGETDKLRPPTTPMFFFLHSVDFGAE